MLLTASFCFRSLIALNVCFFASATQANNDLESQNKPENVRSVLGATYNQLHTTVDPLDTNDLEPFTIASNPEIQETNDEVHSETSSEYESVNSVLFRRLSVIEKFKRRFQHGIQKFRLSQYVPLVVFVQLINVGVDVLLIPLIYFLKHEDGETMSVENIIEYYVLSSIIAFAFASYIYLCYCFCLQLFK